MQSAQSVIDPTGNWTVDAHLTKTGSPAFDALASKYYQRLIAIVINDVVITAPAINAQRFGGRVTISGSYTAAETKALAGLMTTSYPASLRFRGVTRG